MDTPKRLSGVFAPVLTPFDEALDPDIHRLVRLCRWVADHGCGIVPFGTTSEGNSLSVAEKIALLEGLVEAGIDPNRMLPGTGCCAIPDSTVLTRKAVELGCAGVLMLPPFYYKRVSDDGLYAAYSEVIQRVGASALRIYLYHIPPLSQTPISVGLIERLVKDYGDTVVGIKDSSGQWTNTEAMLAAGWDDFRIFVGSEAFLLANLRGGGAGCISATANVNPGPIHHLYATWRQPGAHRQQQALDRVRRVFEQAELIPALKAIVAHYTGDPAWGAVRPPLVACRAAQRRSLVDALGLLGFELSGIA